MRELTLCLLKPTLMKNPFALRNVYRMMRDENLQSIHNKEVILSKIKAEDFYNCHKNKFFYNRLISYICSGPIGVHILAGDNAIAQWRKLMGPTHVYRAIYSHPNTIRGIFGLTDTRNATHGSDSVESAEKEINFFFPEFSVNTWYQNEFKNCSSKTEKDKI